jgi:YVTN family beta-propeller protein
MSVLAAACAAAAALALPATASAQFEGPPVVPGTKSVLFVANNWDGTADIVDPRTFDKLGRLNVIPDLEERLAEKALDPRKLAYFIAVRGLIGEGNDQYADDMFSSHDGRFLHISRPSMADVVAIEIATGKITWRFPMEGYRADHMAISPDGTRLLVSDSTARKVHALDTATGTKVGEFESGDSPHENNFSEDGSRIFHASIGMVNTPADQPVADSTKGDRWFQIVDARDYSIRKRLDIGQILANHGHEGYSSAVRPMAIAPGERIAYMQLSFLHGFVEFDMETDTPLRIANLPVSEEAQSTPREQYLLDSAHHGLAINHEGTKLCVAGTMSDYAAIVHRDDFSHTIAANGGKPYWSTNSADGRYCFVSFSGDDEVSVIDYASEREVARIGVGDHPQRMRMGLVREEAIGGLPPSPGAPARAARKPAKLRIARGRVARGKLDLRLGMTSRATGRLRAAYRSSGRTTRFSIRIPRRTGAPRPWTVRRSLPRAQRRKATGILTLTYAGSRQVRPDRLRSRVAPRRARLRRLLTMIDERGTLIARGTVSRSVPGVVRLRFDTADESSVLHHRARIRRGRWAPRDAALQGGRRGRSALDPVHGRGAAPDPRQVALEGRQPLSRSARRLCRRDVSGVAAARATTAWEPTTTVAVVARVIAV